MTHKRSHGFTLVELNVALIFVAMLLLAVATTAIYVGKIYQKGLSLKMVNQTGRQMIDQMRRDITQAPSNKVQFVSINSTRRLCLGGISYVYNTASSINNPASPVGQVVRSGPAASSPPITFVRIIDPSERWCRTAAPLMNITPGVDYVEILQPDATIPLAVHQMTVTKIASTTSTATSKQALYQLTVELGTNERNTITSRQCRAPVNSTANFDYCAVREFSTIIRTQGDS